MTRDARTFGGSEDVASGEKGASTKLPDPQTLKSPDARCVARWIVLFSNNPGPLEVGEAGIENLLIIVAETRTMSFLQALPLVPEPLLVKSFEIVRGVTGHVVQPIGDRSPSVNLTDRRWFHDPREGANIEQGPEQNITVGLGAKWVHNVSEGA